MSSQKLIPHLFRTEYSKIVAVLTRRFGFSALETAEDIASDTFLTAMRSWGLEGIPKNPTAWLYVVAKNKAKNYIQRQSTFNERISSDIQNKNEQQVEIDLSAENIQDSQLQMMFAVCHPAVPSEAQIGLALRVLCGFSIDEIANAFLTNKEVINKRLYRAKEKLRQEEIEFESWLQRVDAGLPIVLKTLYLLFNEGYYSITAEEPLRKDLCIDAIRLCTMLIENKATNTPAVNALMALMCFHFSRFNARISDEGDMILYEHQDTKLWNEDYISKGMFFLKEATQGNTLSKFHLEAGIAYWNTQKSESSEKWGNMLRLYDHLLSVEYSPVAALNRTYVFSKIHGAHAAIAECEKLALIENRLYHILLGHLYNQKDRQKAEKHLQRAFEMSTSPHERRIIESKLKQLQ